MFRLRQNVLWWLALAKIIRADLSLFPLCCRNVWSSISDSGWALEVLGCGCTSWIVLFRMPDKFMAVMLSLMSVSVSMFSSRRLVLNVVGCLHVCVTFTC